MQLAPLTVVVVPVVVVVVNGLHLCGRRRRIGMHGAW